MHQRAVSTRRSTPACIGMVDGIFGPCLLGLHFSLNNHTFNSLSNNDRSLYAVKLKDLEKNSIFAVFF